MKEYTITRYSFEDLSPEAQEKALENWRHDLYLTLPDYLMEESMLEELAREITGAYDLPGAEDLKIAYSLSYSQGDGVSFSGRVNKETAPGLSWPDSATYAEFNRGSHFYSHAYTVTPELFDAEDQEISDGIEEFRESYLKICRSLEKYGYKWIEDYTSEAHAREEIEEAGDLFLLSGKVDHPAGVNA